MQFGLVEPEHGPVRHGAQGDGRGGDGHQEDGGRVGVSLLGECADGGVQRRVALDDGHTWESSVRMGERQSNL